MLNLSDAIPVFHSSPTKPILDMALRLIEAHIGVSKGSDAAAVVGWYSANERLGDAVPRQAALKMVSGLASGLEAMGKSLPTHAELVTVLVSNEGTLDLLKDEGGNSGAGLVVFGRDARKHWLRPYAPGNVKCTSTSSKIVRAACLEDAKRVPIYDFEDHMDGGAENLGTRDWLTNSGVSKFVQKSA